MDWAQYSVLARSGAPYVIGDGSDEHVGPESFRVARALAGRERMTIRPPISAAAITIALPGLTQAAAPRGQTSPSPMATAPETWHRVDIRTDAALARTHVTLLGALDHEAMTTIDDAIEHAEANHHTLTIELSQMSSITPDALIALLTRSHHPYRGPLSALTGRD